MTKIKEVINEKLKEVLIENLHSLNNASSQNTINEMYEAMKSDTLHNQLDKFDKDKFREYCWNLAGYTGEEKTPLGYELKRRNRTFEQNVQKAITLYYAYLNKGDQFKIEFKNNKFMIPQTYIDGSKEANKNPDKKVVLPSSKIDEASQFVVSGTRKAITKKTPPATPEFIDTVTEAINNFAEALLSKNLVVNNTTLNYQELYTKFKNPDVVKKLEKHINFCQLLISAYKSSEIAFNKSKGNGDTIDYMPDSRKLTSDTQEFKEFTPKFLLQAEAK